MLYISNFSQTNIFYVPTNENVFYDFKFFLESSSRGSYTIFDRYFEKYFEISKLNPTEILDSRAAQEGFNGFFRFWKCLLWSISSCLDTRKIFNLLKWIIDPQNMEIFPKNVEIFVK